MALDRDLTVAVVRASRTLPSREGRGWETNAATGVRGLRLLAEGGRFGTFRLSEASEVSFATLAANCGRYSGARAVREDARSAVFPQGPEFDYVDIDPYGSPVPFVAAGLAALRPGGTLAVSATDMMVLAGAQPRAARRLYGADPVRGRLGTEGAVRILLGHLVGAVRAAGRDARVLLAYVGDHHVRVFLEVGPATGAQVPVGSLDPAAFSGPPLGTHGRVGPLWLGGLGEPELLERLAVPPTAASPGPLGVLLGLLREEVRVPAPFYYEGNALAAALQLERPPGVVPLIEGLRAAGFRACRTHVRPEGIRTDAPRQDVERLARSLSGRA